MLKAGDRGYEACGGYELFRSQKNFVKAKAEVARFNNWIEERAGEPTVYEAQRLNGYPVIYNRLEGALHPGKMMQQLVQKVTRAGVEIRWYSPVRQTQLDGRDIFDEGSCYDGALVT